MIKRNRTASMAESAIRLRNYIVENPDLDQDELMKATKINSQASLYSLLLGLNNDVQICPNGEFLVLKDGKRLINDDIDDFFRHNPTRGKNAPSLAERLLYLYWCLHKAIPEGGLTFEAIKRIYSELFMDSAGQVPKDNTLKRMIYRDMQEFERLKIWIDRSEATKKYSLRDEYLPKLSAESAAAVYVSMLLYRDTLMDQATLCAKEQLEKAFFKKFPERSKLLNERIYVIGDTLANPKAFGDILGKLVRAVAESLRIKINYINNEGEKSERLLEPLGLICKRNVWYLVAFDLGYNEYRTFRVDQMLHLTLRESETFAYPSDFSLPEYIGCSWGVFNNDAVETVRLKFSPKVAHRVKNLHYHPSQKIAEECADGSVILEFQVCGLVEMQNWIIQWGTEVEVLEPLALREEIVQTARNSINRYRVKNKRRIGRKYEC